MVDSLIAGNKSEVLSKTMIKLIEILKSSIVNCHSSIVNSTTPSLIKNSKTSQTGSPTTFV